MAGLRQIVDPPGFTPLSYGLLSVVENITPADGHWQNGITYTSHCVTGMGAVTWEECIVVTGAGGPPPAPPSKTGNVSSGHRGATPFTPYTEFDCSPVGNNQAMEVATRALAQVEPFQVERAFWTGQPIPGGAEMIFPHLAADTNVVDAQGILLQTVPITGGPFNAAEGLGFLESQLGSCYGGRGVIHVPSIALPTLVAWNLVTASGPVLKTTKGNLVAVGDGYPGTSPAGTAPGAGQSWLYATGSVFAFRSQVLIPSTRESFDRSKNTLKMIAERTYVLGFECCHVGALIDLGVPV